MVESRKAVFLVNVVSFVNFVRTCISLKFPLQEREISHKVHKAASDGPPSNQLGQSKTAQGQRIISKSLAH
jgi:hypothetical protein